MSEFFNRVIKLLFQVLILFCILPPEINAQTFFTTKWAKTYESDASESIRSSIKLSDGSYLMIGESKSGNEQNTKIVILKTDKEGNLLSRKVAGGNDEYKFQSVCKSREEGFYVLGTKHARSSKPLIWLAKFDNNGLFLWEGTAGGGEREKIVDLVETKDLEIFACGYKEIKGDHDTDGWLVKFSKKGTLESQALFGTRYINDELTSISSDNSGGFIIAGTTSQKIGSEKIPYIISVDNRGNKIWEKSYTNLIRARPVSTFCSKEGLIICMSEVSSSANIFEKGVKLVLNASGEVVNSSVFNKQLNINKYAYIRFDNNDMVFLSSSENENESFILRFDNNMNLIWFKPLDLKGYHLECLSKIDENNFFVTGWINRENYKPEAIALHFQDNFQSESEAFIKKQMISAAGMNENENFIDFQSRIGKQKYDELYDKYKNDAVNSLNFIPHDYIAEAKTDNDSRVSVIASAKNNVNVSENPELKGKYYALLIAINDYKDPSINNLDKPIGDAQKLFDILVERYAFEKTNVTFLKNPTREQIISSLDKLEKDLTTSDNLLIFYAGHGYWNPSTQKGYWLASDASKLNTANWIGNSSISDYIRSIPSKHTLLIADACFSGSIFKTREAFGNLDKSAQKLYELPSRKAMTSGTLTVVPDKSIFVEYLLKRLKENSESFLSAEQLFFSFKPAVLNNTENIPQFGVIGNAGDEGGDFIFVNRNK